MSRLDLYKFKNFNFSNLAPFKSNICQSQSHNVCFRFATSGHDFLLDEIRFKKVINNLVYNYSYNY